MRVALLWHLSLTYRVCAGSAESGAGAIQGQLCLPDYLQGKHLMKSFPLLVSCTKLPPVTLAYLQLRVIVSLTELSGTM